MNGKTILVSRPGHDLVTKYLFDWSKRLLELAEEKGANTLDLRKQKANRKEVTSRIGKLNPNVILLNGHGDANTVCGHNNKAIVDRKNKSVLKGSITYARSCDSAAALGPECVKNGAKAYIGYIEPFWLPYDVDKTHHPLEDKTAQYVLEPSNHVIVSLLKGHSAGD